MANNLTGRIGKMIVLPSTFIESPCNMLQNYQDSMAIVNKFYFYIMIYFLYYMRFSNTKFFLD